MERAAAKALGLLNETHDSRDANIVGALGVALHMLCVATEHAQGGIDLLARLRAGLDVEIKKAQQHVEASR